MLGATGFFDHWIDESNGVINFKSAGSRDCLVFVSIKNIYTEYNEPSLQNRSILKRGSLIYFNAFFLFEICNIDCFYADCAWTKRKPKIIRQYQENDVTELMSHLKPALTLGCSSLSIVGRQKISDCKKCRRPEVEMAGDPSPISAPISKEKGELIIQSSGNIWMAINDKEGLISLTAPGHGFCLIWFNNQQFLNEMKNKSVLKMLGLMVHFEARLICRNLVEPTNWFEAVSLWVESTKPNIKPPVLSSLANYKTSAAFTMNLRNGLLAIQKRLQNEVLKYFILLEKDIKQYIPPIGVTIHVVEEITSFVQEHSDKKGTNTERQVEHPEPSSYDAQFRESPSPSDSESCDMYIDSDDIDLKHLITNILGKYNLPKSVSKEIIEEVVLKVAVKMECSKDKEDMLLEQIREYEKDTNKSFEDKETQTLSTGHVLFSGVYPL